MTTTSSTEDWPLPDTDDLGQLLSEFAESLPAEEEHPELDPKAALLYKALRSPDRYQMLFHDKEDLVNFFQALSEDPVARILLQHQCPRPVVHSTVPKNTAYILDRDYFRENFIFHPWGST